MMCLFAETNIRFLRNDFAQDSIYWKEELECLWNKNKDTTNFVIRFSSYKVGHNQISHSAESKSQKIFQVFSSQTRYGLDVPGIETQ